MCEDNRVTLKFILRMFCSQSLNTMQASSISLGHGLLFRFVPLSSLRRSKTANQIFRTQVRSPAGALLTPRVGRHTIVAEGPPQGSEYSRLPTTRSYAAHRGCITPGALGCVLVNSSESLLSL